MKSPRCWVSLVVLALLASLTLSGMVGCAKKEPVDPYVYASLRQIMTGAVLDTVTRNFTFEIDAPRFEYVRGNVGIIRDGNMLQFLVAKDLENLAPRLKGALLGVRMTFTPSPTHLVLQRIKRNGVVEQDSMPAPEKYELPHLLRSVDMEEPGAPLPDMKWRDSKSIEQFLPAEDSTELLKVQSAVEKLVWKPKFDLPDSVMANPSPKDMAWYAVFPDATVQIVDVTPGADYMLHLLLDKDLPLVGSFSMKSMFEYVDRKKEHPDLGHVIGTMKVNWFRYANTFVQASEED